MIQVEKCTPLNFLLLFVALHLHKVTSTTYFVISDDASSHHMDTNAFSLQHYLNNTSKYFVSHNQLHFMQGQYYINNDLVIKDVDNFTITGVGQCTIICTSPASIVIMNVDNAEFQNFNLINCIKNHKDIFNKPFFNTISVRDSIPFHKHADYYTSLLLYNSSSVILYNININATVNTSFTGVLIVNVKERSEITDVKVQVNFHNCKSFLHHPIEISGLKLIVCFYDRISTYGLLSIDNFYYNINKPCENHLLCVSHTVFRK